MGFDENGGGGANVPDWTEDGNSPATASGSTSTTYTLATNSDLVKIFVRAEDANSTQAGIDLRVNGDSGNNYDTNENDGTETTNATEWVSVMFYRADVDAIGRMYLAPGESGILFDNGPHAGFANHAEGGHNKNETVPVTQFTFLAGSSTDFTIEAYTRAVG